jgi:hypothetical protein
MEERNREGQANINRKGTSEPDDPVQTDSPQAVEEGERINAPDTERAAQIDKAREIQRKERARGGR